MTLNPRSPVLTPEEFGRREAELDRQLAAPFARANPRHRAALEEQLYELFFEFRAAEEVRHQWAPIELDEYEEHSGPEIIAST
jgi:hypothetical protein